LADLRSLAVLLLFSSIITAFFGIILLFMYKGSVEYYHVANFYPGLYLGILNLITAAFGIIGGIAMLKRKYFTLSVISLVLLLCSGLAPPIALALDGYVWTNGLMLGLPQITFPVITLALVAVSKREAKE
jgi:hypothetical protein